jgi:hypothetical protein
LDFAFQNPINKFKLDSFKQYMNPGKTIDVQYTQQNLEEIDHLPALEIDYYRWQKEHHNTLASQLLEEAQLMDEEQQEDMLQSSMVPSSITQMIMQSNYYLTSREPIFLVQKMAGIAAKPPARILDENIVKHGLMKENAAFPLAWHMAKQRIAVEEYGKYYVDGTKHYLSWSNAFWGHDEKVVILPELNGMVYCCCCNDIYDRNVIKDHIVMCAMEEMAMQTRCECICGEPHGPYHACGMIHALMFFRVLTIENGQFIMQDVRRIERVVLARPLLLAKFYSTSFMDKRDRNLEQISQWYMSQETQPKFLIESIHGTVQYVVNQENIQLACKYCDKFLTTFMPILQQTIFEAFELQQSPCHVCGGPAYKYDNGHHCKVTSAIPTVIIPIDVTPYDAETVDAMVTIEGHNNVQYTMLENPIVTFEDGKQPHCRATASKEVKSIMAAYSDPQSQYGKWHGTESRYDTIYRNSPSRGTCHSNVTRDIPYQILSDGRMLKLRRHGRQSSYQKKTPVIPYGGTENYTKWKIKICDNQLHYVMY